MFTTCEALADRNNFYFWWIFKWVFRVCLSIGTVHTWQELSLLYLLHKHYMSDAYLLLHEHRDALLLFNSLVLTKGCFALSDLNITCNKLCTD